MVPRICPPSGVPSTQGPWVVDRRYELSRLLKSRAEPMARRPQETAAIFSRSPIDINTVRSASGRCSCGVIVSTWERLNFGQLTKNGRSEYVKIIYRASAFHGGAGAGTTPLSQSDQKAPPCAKGGR